MADRTKTRLRLLAIHTVPLWNDHGEIRPPHPGEVRPDLANHVAGWANILHIDINGEQRTLLAGQDK